MHSLQNIIQEYDTFLLDASGVIYTDEGTVEGAAAAIQAMQKKGRVFVVTNNSHHHAHMISEKLARTNIHIAPDHIISSGLGLALDPSINALIQNKTIYVFGYPSAYPYIHNAGAKAITEQLEISDVIVMTAKLPNEPSSRFEALVTHIQTHPQKPIICCNPDIYIMGINGLLPVIGYYAKELERRTGVSIHWIGKPLSNFSHVVRQILTHHRISNQGKICFFDDNPDNIKTLSTDLGISGCIIHQTGLSKTKASHTLTHLTNYLIPSLKL